MNLSFFGATREVTGSCYLLQSNRTRILVDCGMFQGSAFADAKNFKDFSFDPSTIDAVLITHAHLDHVGRLPKLVRHGFKGKIYSTAPTAKLAELVLRDAAQIMEGEFRRELRPKLYEPEDVDTVMNYFVPVEYGRKLTVGNFSFRFRDAGHIMGSSFIEIEEPGGPRIAFSGDLGNVPDPILQPTAQLAAQDVLVMESTYGDRLHEELGSREQQLKAVVIETLKQRGVLLIPAFAIERTQELLFELNHLVENRLIPAVDIYLDSPMAIHALEVMQEYPQYYNEKALARVSQGDDLFTFPGLHMTRSRDDSKTINESPNPKVIIAGSGMMNAGRILHHLVRYLGSAKNTVLIIGYQAHGTLGRRLYTGERIVDVLGERITVKARVKSIGAYSAHADQGQLVNWVRTAKTPPKRIFCTHGEEGSSSALASRIREELHLTVDVPRFEDTITL